MDNGGQPAAGGHWLAAAPPNFRNRVAHKIMKNLSHMLHGHQVDDLRLYRSASEYEAKVFNQSNNAQDYLRTISRKMLGFQPKRQPVVQAAPDHQEQAHMGHQMRPLNAILANSSAPATPQTASTIPLTVRPPQVQNMHIKVNQAHPSFATPSQVAPVVQLHPRHPQPTLTGMNQQKDLRQSYHTHGGQQSNVAPMQIRHHEGQSRKQFGHPQQSAGEVDWREDIFQKITSLKDARLSEIMELERAVRACVPRIKTNEQLNLLPKEQAAHKYTKAVNIMERIRYVLSFLQFQKSSTPEHAKNQFHKYQTSLNSLLQLYREIKSRNARKGIKLQSQNCHELPRVVNITGANQQKHEEQPAVRAFPQSSQNVPAATGSPLGQQESYSEHLAGEAENVKVHREADAPAADVNLTAVSGDTAHSTGGTCNQEVRQEHQTDESISQLTHNVDPCGTLPAQQQNCSAHSVRVEAEDDTVQAEAETPVVMEKLIERGINAARSLSPAALRSLASDMGVNLKRAFRHTTPGTVGGSSCAWFDPAGTSPAQQQTNCAHSARVQAEDDSVLAEAETPVAVEAAKTSLSPAALRSGTGVSLKRAFCHTTSDTMDGNRKSCSKRRRTHHGSLLDEIRATCSTLVETHISISKDDTGGADGNGTVIELCYNAVSLAPDFRAVIGASEILTKLLVPADYPQSSPVIHGDGQRRSGLPGVVDMAFRRAIVLLPEPRSVEGMARAWDSVARRAVAQFAHRLGGGMFGTRYNNWESCIPV